MKKHIIRPSVLRHTLENSFFLLPMTWGYLIIVAVGGISIYLETAGIHMNLTTVLWVFALTFIYAWMATFLWALIVNRVYSITFTPDTVVYNDVFHNRRIAVEAGTITKVFYRNLNLSIRTGLGINAPGIPFWLQISDIVRHYKDPVGFGTSSTGRALRKNLIDKHGGGHHEPWYGSRWLEIHAGKNTVIFPVSQFDSYSRGQLVRRLQEATKKHKS